MDVHIVTTSLEALIHRATSSTGSEPLLSAVEAFCVVLKKENEGPYIASRVIAAKMQSENINVALHALSVLETCMKQCGPTFHAEIGKFKFLNEMVKLVSPKYLGSKTPPPIKDKVLHLMHAWTFEYPKEVKIKEAYEMLQKQGVIKDDIPPLLPTRDETLHNPKPKNVVFEDDEKSKLLKKLLQSKNPDDLQAANRLIKSMFREDERRVQMKHKRLSDINIVNENVSLLNEMLESYKPGITSDDEIELVKELYATCKQLQPKVYRLAQETQGQEEMLNLTSEGGKKNLNQFWSLTKQFDEILHASDEMMQVFDKYKKVMEEGIQLLSTPNESQENASSLLDICSNDNHIDSEKVIPKPDNNLTTTNSIEKELIDIFASLDTNLNETDKNILQPISLIKPGPSGNELLVDTSTKLTAFDELDLLGENLLKSSLPESCRTTAFNKPIDKIPMNLLAKPTPQQDSTTNLSTAQANHLDFSFLMGDLLGADKPTVLNDTPPASNGDDLMVDLTDNLVVSTEK